ncbi:hypothetical protein U1Q18_009932, partial [Sarracenia purpurea var. burkii]
MESSVDDETVTKVDLPVANLGKSVAGGIANLGFPASPPPLFGNGSEMVTPESVGDDNYSEVDSSVETVAETEVALSPQIQVSSDMISDPTSSVVISSGYEWNIEFGIEKGDGPSRIQLPKAVNIDGYAAAHKVFDEMPKQDLCASADEKQPDGGVLISGATKKASVEEFAEGTKVEVSNIENIWEKCDIAVHAPKVFGNLLKSSSETRGIDATSGDAPKVLGPEVKAPVWHSWANVVKGGGPGPKPRQIPNLEYIAPTNLE